MCFGTIKNLTIVFLPFILTGVGFGIYLVSTAPRDPREYNDAWFGIVLGILGSPIAIYMLAVHQTPLILIPYILYYIAIIKYRREWL
jgi:hypothetical protein